MSDKFNCQIQKWLGPVRFGVLLALLIFATYPQVVLGLQTFVARDYGVFVMPLAQFQKNCLWQGQIPFWDPYNNCGVPFLAQWNTMPLYPPSLFYLALPLKWSMGCFSLLHLWWAGIGMYFLARRWTEGNNFAAAFAGTAFAFNGFALNLIMWPSHMATYSWMPWVILAVELAWRKGWHHINLAAFAGAMQMLAGGPELILFTWLISSAFWLQQFIKSESPRVAMLWRYPLVVVLVFSLAAVQLLPFLDLVAHAQREAGYADLRWSMPLSGLANFLVPTAFGDTAGAGIFFQRGQYWTSSYYLPLTTLWLALLALLTLRDRRIRLLGAIALAGLIFAMGENTPVLPLLRKFLPQLSIITYPIKYVALVIFATPLLAACALANFSAAQKRLIPVGVALLVSLAGVVACTQLAPAPGDNTALAWTAGLGRVGFLVVAAIILLALKSDKTSRVSGLVALLLLLVAWLDVFTHEPAQNPTVTPAVYQQGLAREKLNLRPKPILGGSRVMVSPAAADKFVHFALANPKDNFLAKRLGFCANCNLFDDMPKVDGFFSLTPRECDLILSAFYTTTNASYPRFEDFMGVSHITSPDSVLQWQTRSNFLPLVTGGQMPIFLDDGPALTNMAQDYFDARKVVFLPPELKSAVSVSAPGETRIIKSEFGNDTVDIKAEATAPALIVVAQTYYHNWKAKIDGSPVPLFRANVAFQAIEMPAGKHQIHLFYEDRAFQIGAAISGCMLLNCLVSLLLIARRSLPPTPPEPEEEDNYI